MKKPRKGWIFASACAAGLLAAARPAAADEAPLRVVATVGMVADLVRTVGGERVAVAQLIGSGMDPHLYKPTRSDVARLLAADVVFYSGLKLEGKMADTLERLARGGREVRAVTDALAAGAVAPDPAGAGHPDPHVWMDVGAWAGTLDLIRDVLARADPADADGYRARADECRKRLADLDAYVRAVCATIPASARVLVTAHDAFHYFGRAYGLEVHGIQGISTESEAGLERINRLVDLLVVRRIAAIFFESSVADRNVRALTEGTRARGHEVSIGGTLFSDAMGLPGTPEGTYVGMIEHNANTIVRALGGRVPEGGFAAWRGGAP